MILINSTMMPRNNRVSMHQIESELLFLRAISVENCKVHKVWKFDAIEREMVPICVQNLNIYFTKYAERRSRNEIPSTSMCSSRVFILMPSTKNIMIWSLQDSFCILYVTRLSYIYWWTKVHFVNELWERCQSINWALGTLVKHIRICYYHILYRWWLPFLH